MRTVLLRQAIRRILPSQLGDRLAAVHRHWDFKMKSFRESPTDYIVEFEHRDIRKARASILWNDDWDAATTATIQILQEMDLVRDGQTIIDYGCGIGRMTKALTDSFQVKVFAVDRAREMRRHAQEYIPAEHLEDGSVVIWSDQELLDRLPVGEVDVLLFVEVFQHVPEPILDSLMPQLLRTLSPNGRLVVLGNALLDVDSQGNVRSKPVAEALCKYVDVLHHSVWDGAQVGNVWKGFFSPRQVFVCAPRIVRHEYNLGRHPIGDTARTVLTQ